jgi:hypothetical protein
MRTTLFVTAVLGTVLFACTSEVKSSDFARPDGGDSGSGDGGVKTGTPIKSPSTSKDAGALAPKPPPSSAPATCKGVVECLAVCEEDSACDACYGGMSDDELKELQDISLCIADSGCTTDECMAELCADVIDICLSE